MKLHFSRILNCPEPPVRQEFNTNEAVTLDIRTDDISVQEVQAEINKLKNNKAAGIDNILQEYLKCGDHSLVMSLSMQQSMVCRRDPERLEELNYTSATKKKETWITVTIGEKFLCYPYQEK